MWQERFDLPLRASAEISPAAWRGDQDCPSWGRFSPSFVPGARACYLPWMHTPELLYQQTPFAAWMKPYGAQIRLKVRRWKP